MFHPTYSFPYFTNLDFPEIRRFPLLNHHLGAQVVWGRYNLPRIHKAISKGPNINPDRWTRDPSFLSMCFLRKVPSERSKPLWHSITLPETNIAHENPYLSWYNPSKWWIFHGYVSLQEGILVDQWPDWKIGRQSAIFQHVSHKKKRLTVHYTGWLKGILKMAYDIIPII